MPISPNISRNTSLPSSITFPSTWQDNLGNWWLLAGKEENQTVKTHLWKYSIEKTWKLVFNGSSVEIDFGFWKHSQAPILCGKVASSKVVILDQKSQKVWIYIVQPAFNDSNTNPHWKSYNCNDNNVRDKCPDISPTDFAWCDHSGIMVLQTSNHSTEPNWWKFDIDSENWIALPKLRLPTKWKVSQNLEKCRLVATTPSKSSIDQFVYFLCPAFDTTKSFVTRNIIVFIPARGEFFAITNNIQLKNAFVEKGAWLSRKTVMHAIYIPEQNISVIFLAYHQVLDLWVHNHTCNDINKATNIWKGESLLRFERHQSFYQLDITAKENFTAYSTCLLNPRAIPLQFEGFEKFTLKLGNDSNVFLAMRDAPGMDESLTSDVKKRLLKMFAKNDTSQDTPTAEKRFMLNANAFNKMGEKTHDAINMQDLGMEGKSVGQLTPGILFALALSFFGSLGLITCSRRCARHSVRRDSTNGFPPLDNSAQSIKYSVLSADNIPTFTLSTA